MAKSLGFKSNLLYYYDSVTNFQQMGPQYISESGRDFYNGGENWKSYLSYISPFDSLIQSSSDNEKFDSVAVEALNFERFYNQNYTGLEIRQLLSTHGFSTTTRKLYTMSNSKILVAKLSDGTSMPLDRLSLGLASPVLRDTEEALVSSHNQHSWGFQLSPILERFSMETIFGPDSLKLLEEIGYSTRRNPQQLKLVYDQQDFDFMKNWDIMVADF